MTIKNWIGILIIFLILIVTFLLWLFSKPDLIVLQEFPLQALGQITALLGFILISLSLFFTIKPIFIDRLFGGIDKVLKIHRFLGGIALILLINHPLFFIASDLPNFELAKLNLLPSNDLAYSLGVISIYLMLFSFFWMVFIRLPYHIWKLSHQMLGIAFLAGGVHSFIISSDVSRFMPLQAWTAGFFILGLGSFLYSVFLYARYGPKYHFIVEKIERSLDIVNIYLKPIGKMFNFVPGQFIYASFDSKPVGSEAHPFSISSAPDEELLRLSAKISGDYTLRLPSLEERTPAVIYGPYGGFGKNVSKGQDSVQLWIAGGIGVAPFLSLLHSQKKNPVNAYIYFFYLYKSREEGVFCEEIHEIIKECPHINIQAWCSKEKGRLSSEILSKYITEAQNTKALLCGPPAMTTSLSKQLISLGVLPDKIFFEDFDMG